MRRAGIVAVLLTLVGLFGGPARAAGPVDEVVAELKAEARVEVGGGLPELLWAMAEDPALAGRVTAAADRRWMALTDTLLSLLSLPEPVALQHLPELHVVRDFGPPAGERPPTWADLREVGVPLLEAIALDPSVGRDQRLRRELARLRAENRDPKPSDVAGLVAAFRQWWVDRGDDPSLTHDSSRIPDVAPWIARIETEVGEDAWSGLAILQEIDHQPLRRRLFLEALSPDRHAHLAAEFIRVQKLYGVDLRELGVPARRWDAEAGRFRGHRATDLREHARAILRRVTGRIASGVDEQALRNDWLYWWQRARFEARYWRDPHDGPTLERWFTGLDRPESEGGVPATGWVREIYVALGARELILEQLGAEQSPLVAELIELLPLDREEVIARGLHLAYLREPLLPRRDYDGELVAIPWDQARAVIVEALEAITGVSPRELSGEGDLSSDLLFWQDWWRRERFDPRWYRDPARVPERQGAFEPQRGRID